MARTAGATAEGPQGPRGVEVILELSEPHCVRSSEVGGLLKRAVSLELVFRRPPSYLATEGHIGKGGISPIPEGLLFFSLVLFGASSGL